jgi:hypothetical protein
MDNHNTAHGATQRTGRTQPAGVDLDKLEARARAAYLADERSVAWLQPAEVLDLIALAQRAQPRVTEQASERPLFEAWAKSKEPRTNFQKHPDLPGEYFDMFTQVRWTVWQARAALTQAAPEAPALIQALETGDGRESSRWFDIHPSEIATYVEEGYKVRKLYEYAPAVSQKDGAAAPCPSCNNIGWPDGKGGSMECPTCGRTPSTAATTASAADPAMYQGIKVTAARTDGRFAAGAITASASIDTPEFRELVDALLREYWSLETHVAALIAYIDSRTAGTAPEPARQPAPNSDADPTRDPLYDKAVMIVRARNRASVSLVQRELLIGYNRASRLFDAMESAGVISPASMDGYRTVLAAAPTPKNSGKEKA